MTLLNNLNTASSGLGVSSTSMSVIGDNIANLNTIGYKGSRASFGDLLPNDVAGLSGVSSIGTGAATQSVTALFGQGALQQTGNSLDMAINGGGFFMLEGAGEETFFSRNGQFGLDEEGFIVNGAGLRLQGYGAEGGDVGKTISDLQVTTAAISPQQTAEIGITANLDSAADYDDTPIADGTYTLDGTDTTVNEFASDGDFTTSATIYDSQGEAHDVTVVYEKTSENTWGWYAVVDAGELDGGLEDGKAFQISSGTLEFDTDGDMTSFTQVNENDLGNAWRFSEAEQTDFDFQFGLDANGDPTERGGLSQNAGDSAVSQVSQDGYATGDLAGLQIGSDGTIMGTYTNGQEIALGQVALADFTSETGLERIGGSLFQATMASGLPAVGAAGAGGRGDIVGGALESSNVELEDQFVNMISSQRSYQANSRVFSSTDQLLQELVNLV
jgi:flagellar hook protein FlgE